MSVSKTTPKSAIDAQSDEPVLEYVGPGTIRDVPAADLHGGELARVAYARALPDAHAEWEQSEVAEDGTRAAFVQPKVTGSHLRALADELVASGLYRLIHKSHAAEAPPTEPATPAATPEG